MGGLAPVHYRTLRKFLEAVGCRFVRQKGSHLVFWREDQLRPIIIPAYAQVPKFVIRNMLRQLKVPIDEYLRIVKDL
jgi:predicted RNA binding protein YcfA (HicA-like mRNA interferase family)